MNSKSRKVIITIDREIRPEIGELLDALKEQGLTNLSKPATVFTVTQITGECTGDLGRFTSEGVKCEPNGWKYEQKS